ncbi:MAG: hypothetical protein ACTS6A_02180 [Candidatus Hodgkinia cicadicola]
MTTDSNAKSTYVVRSFSIGGSLWKAPSALNYKLSTVYINYRRLNVSSLIAKQFKLKLIRRCTAGSSY